MSPFLRFTAATKTANAATLTESLVMKFGFQLIWIIAILLLGGKFFWIDDSADQRNNVELDSFY